MKWYTYLICGILMILGVFSTISLVRTFNVKSGEYGSVVIFDRAQKYETFSHFDLSGLQFETEDFVNYTLIDSDVAQDFNGIRNQYDLLFNGKPLNNLTQSAGVISGDYILSFKDMDGSVVSNVNLHIKVEYSAQATEISVTTTNDQNSISYLNASFNIDGAIVDVVVKGVK